MLVLILVLIAGLRGGCEELVERGTDGLRDDVMGLARQAAASARDPWCIHGGLSPPSITSVGIVTEAATSTGTD